MDLSDFVKSARHAVAINERREDFMPTLWTNIGDLNEQAGFTNDADDAPYREMWFPGTHSSVGGGGDRRGLSDQALHWIWEGAMRMGLEFDTTESSKIFSLSPDYTEYLEDSKEPSFFYKVLNIKGKDRLPGPSELYEVSRSAKKRWLESADRLKDKTAYRPGTPTNVRAKLNTLKPPDFGVGKAFRAQIAGEECKLYRVKRGDTLTAIANNSTAMRPPQSGSTTQIATSSRSEQYFHRSGPAPTTVRHGGVLAALSR